MRFFDRYKDYLPKKKTKEELDKHYENIKLEKGDMLAMIIAAFITFFPVLIAALVVFYGILWLFASR